MTVLKRGSEAAVTVLLLCFVVSVNTIKTDNCKVYFKDTKLNNKVYQVAEPMYLIDLSIKNTMHGLVTTYFPDTQYDIIIRPKSTALSFKEFHFKMKNVNETKTFGALELRDPELSTFDSNDHCYDRVVNLATPNKPNITIGWQSPPTNSGCIEMTAYVKETEIRYHNANLTVCEDERVELDNPGEILRNCCACELAKYEMTFEGMWSKYSHPRNFPKKEWMAGFPTVVGAAHDAHYTIWQVYANASEGLKKFAETGNSVPLELELKAQKDNITTFIKFRGTNFKNNTLARVQLRVDRKNHVVSLLGRINPSPDWFIGVSRLELCQRNCTWIEDKTLNLYPYDVGSRSGIGFEQEDNGYTNDVINHMNMSWPVPKTVGNKTTTPPFYDRSNNTHEVRPMARIHLRRIRTYGSTCLAVKKETKANEECVGEWNKTIDCSVTCGRGLTVYKRDYKEGYNASNCEEKLERVEPCGNAAIKCEEPINEDTCQLTEWSDWERCSKRCGQESIKRTRSYQIEVEHVDKCKRKFPNNQLQEYKDCGHSPCPSSETVVCEDSLYRAWSTWGPCSVTLGFGLRYRHRELVSKVTNKLLADSGFASCLYEKQVCEGVDPASITEAPLPDPNPDSAPFDWDNSPARTSSESIKQTYCSLPLDEGESCSGTADDTSHQWGYNKDTNRCEVFAYLGCGGNDNRFVDQFECQAKCIKEKIECKMSEWTEWSRCTECQKYSTRERHVEIQPSPGAKPCPVANRSEKRPCLQRATYCKDDD